MGISGTNLNTPRTRYARKVIRKPSSDPKWREHLRYGTGTWVYPWETWTNGAWWEIIQGEDYPPTKTAKNMRAQLHDHARRNGYFVTTFQNEHKTGMVFQFYEGRGRTKDQFCDIVEHFLPISPFARDWHYR